MNKNTLKFLSLILTYVFFILIIVISINSVVPEKDLQVLKPEQNYVKKIDNYFARDENSVYEILEKDNRKSQQIMESEKSKPNIKIINDENNKDNFRIQFASFKEKQKSMETSNRLREKIAKMSLGISLIVKEVKIKENQIFYRVISESKYPYGKANRECKKLIKNKIQCIIIKS